MSDIIVLVQALMGIVAFIEGVILIHNVRPCPSLYYCGQDFLFRMLLSSMKAAY